MEIQYLTLSFSHKNTPINVRERLAMRAEHTTPFLKQLKQKITAIEEVLFVSTCNRVEFYIITYMPQECIVGVLDLFSKAQGVALSEMEKYCQIALNKEAVHHIFGVVSSLDSVVIGETQIAGQIKEAYKKCFDLGVCARYMTRLIHFAFRCAAFVRNQTTISKNSVSVASVAIKSALACKSDKRDALVIGLGEIGKLAVKYLLDSGFDITLINRNIKKANDFIQGVCYKDNSPKITVLEFERLPEVLHNFTFVFSATGASEPIITNNMLPLDDMPRFWFDLAVPRDIQAGIHSENLQIFCVDDLKNTIQKNLHNKKIQTHQAYAIVGNAVNEYFGWIQGFDVEPLIKIMRQNAKNACMQELNRAIKKRYLPPEWEEEVKIILHNAFNVFLHNPTLHLRDLASQKEGDSIIEAIRIIFGNKDTKQAFINYYKCEYITT